MTLPKDANRRRIVLMRHGSVTYFDSAGRAQLPEFVSLNEAGRAQATAAGRLFASAGLTFDRVIISGLPRTRETAKLVLAELNQTLEPVVDHELREMEGGRIPSGLSPEAVRDAFGTALDRAAPEDARFLGGESVKSLLDRLLPRLDALRADPSWDIMLLVLHGAVNRAALSYLITGERRFLGGFSQAAGCINVLDVGPEKDDVVMRLMNHSPLDVLQVTTRQTTLEELHAQYVKSQQG